MRIKNASNTQCHIVGKRSKNFGFEGGFVSTGSSMFLNDKLVRLSLIRRMINGTIWSPKYEKNIKLEKLEKHALFTFPFLLNN